MSKTRRPISFWRCLLLLVAILSMMLVFCMVRGGIQTHRRRAEIRSRVTPGMTVPELHKFLGKPMRIQRLGTPPVQIVGSYTPPALTPGTAIHFYADTGIPYYNTYVLVDEASARVLNCDIVGIPW